MRRGEVAGRCWSDVGLDAEAAGTVAWLILGDSEQEPARPVDKGLSKPE